MQYFSANVNVREQPEITNQDICVPKKKKKLKKPKQTKGRVLLILGFQLVNGKTPDIFVLHILEYYS